MLEDLLPFWRGKLFVLVLLGFVATSWIITITLSAADASVHVLESPFFPAALHGHAVGLTVVLLLVLGGVVLLGFTEAVSVAIPLVAVFLVLNAIVVVRGAVEVFSSDGALAAWLDALISGDGGFSGIAGPAIVAFPLLVLGLSGFETGVSMMPLVAAQGDDPHTLLRSRIRNTRKLLTAAALIMSVSLISTSFVTTVLIPKQEFQAGGQAKWSTSSSTTPLETSSATPCATTRRSTSSPTCARAAMPRSMPTRSAPAGHEPGAGPCRRPLPRSRHR